MTIVSNSIILSPPFSNQQVFSFVEDDFPRKPIEEVSCLLKSTVDFIRENVHNFQTNISVSSELDCVQAYDASSSFDCLDSDEDSQVSDSFKIRLLCCNSTINIDQRVFTSIISWPKSGRGSKVVSFACGYGYFAAVDTEGYVYTWGDSGCGRLGTSLTIDMDCQVNTTISTHSYVFILIFVYIML